ncbi:glycoside hydrolase family 5 protein [Natronoflexus pectinivorans]|uniref:Mannan endo-1,4-beta-mannosidase n=1 Tax=Natronoflexus pectinivorans TaxID=682526 RepID=A0A4R2G969_9BACT|nr:cellulase family glycosylhydrolase [Natronoflexus pectinivorans]TCO04448.1 mannan endo-1,4-beta-mannosidase [Natronoflexus pectinivorans]
MRICWIFSLVTMLGLTNCNSSSPSMDDVVYVKGRHIYTANHEKLVMRGVNEMFIWSDDLIGDTIIPEIVKTNSNTLRIVWLTDSENINATPENLDKIIQNTADAGMFPMPELHGATGKWEKLQEQVDYWVRPEVVEVLKKHERYLLLNIANECGGHDVDAKTFRKGYELAIDRIRATGLRCPLVIDASGWGQDLDILLETGPGLLKHDPLSNLIFSVHMWWVAEDGSTQRIIDGIEQSVELNLPLIVGEFAPMGVNCARYIDYETIMEQCQKRDIGWLAWSWGAVENGDCAEMDMTRGELRGKFKGLTDWGLEVAVTHPYSIKNTSIKPSLK